MLKVRGVDTPDFGYYERVIGENGKVWMDLEKVLSKLSKDSELLRVVEGMMIRHMRLVSGEKMYSFDRATLFNYLKRCEGIHENSLGYYGRDGFKESLDVGKVIRPLYEKGLAQEFLELYLKRSSLKSDVSRTQKMRERFSAETVMNEDGKGLMSLAYVYNRGETGRYYTRDYNVQAISRRYNDCMTVPDGWYLLWFDFDQIDLRVMYNLLLKGDREDEDRIFGVYKDKYEAMARIIRGRVGEGFDKGQFVEERDNYKTGGGV